MHQLSYSDPLHHPPQNFVSSFVCPTPLLSALFILVTFFWLLHQPRCLGFCFGSSTPYI